MDGRGGIDTTRATPPKLRAMTARRLSRRRRRAAADVRKGRRQLGTWRWASAVAAPAGCGCQVEGVVGVRAKLPPQLP